MSSPELQPHSSQETLRSNESAAERLDDLAKKIEAGAELGQEHLESGEKKAERARVEALESAVSVEKGGSEKKGRAKEGTAPRRRGAISKQEKKASFKRHMNHVQAEMSAPQRAFSKVIHNPAIEKTSEFVGGTLARPNAVLSGAIAAFILVLGVYLIARHFGYVLSGFETIAAFIVGWIFGIAYDYLKLIFTGKK